MSQLRHRYGGQVGFRIYRRPQIGPRWTARPAAAQPWLQAAGTTPSAAAH